MAGVSTYLNLPGNTEAAFEFYRSVFGTQYEGMGASACYLACRNRWRTWRGSGDAGDPRLNADSMARFNPASRAPVSAARRDPSVLFVAVVMSQAAGVRGRPSTGRCSSAAASAS